MTGAPVELLMLVLAGVLGLVHLFWGSAAAQPQRGLEWNVGPRDEPRPLTGRAGRLERAFANYRETFPIFAAVVLACAAAGKLGGLSAAGSVLYLVCRAIYLPLYAFGVPWLRSIVWLASVVGIGLVVVAFFV